MTLNKTQAMVDRENYTNVVWTNKGNGYATGIGYGFGRVAYIALPVNHPLTGKSYDEIYDLDGGPSVNGGLTFAEDNVFGWDYAHYKNDFNIVGHIEAALDYFHRHEQEAK